jgi:hypothetical protein
VTYPGQTADPLTTPSIEFSGDVVDHGPGDLAAAFTFDFGDLAAGATKTFTTFYGAAATETAANNALSAVGAEVYSYGQTADDPTTGTPNTFIFAFEGVGGAPVFPENCTNGIDDDGDNLIDGADPDCAVTPPGGDTTLSGVKYYDANANGQRDDGEPGIAGWPIDFTSDTGPDGTTMTATGTTDTVGTFVLDVPDGTTYTVAERQAFAPWIQTGNTVDQTSGTATTTLNADKSYTVQLGSGQSATGLNFGNVCVGGTGAHTKGFWQNKNGKAALEDEGMAGALQLLNDLNLKNASGGDQSFADYGDLRDWIRKANAKNPKYMLSAQLATMVLNVYVGYVSDADMVLADGANSENDSGFASIGDLIDEANDALQNSADKSYLTLLSGILDAANNDSTFAVVDPTDCPAAVFKFLFQDNFNDENGGTADALDYSGFQNWAVTSGTVDLIGAGGAFDFYPGNGLYVDLDGSTGDAGILSTTLTVPAGTYDLSFDLGGSARGSTETVTVTLNGFTEDFTLGSSAPLATVTRTVVLSGGSHVLSFSNSGGDNVGLILDNVVVKQQ